VTGVDYSKMVPFPIQVDLANDEDLIRAEFGTISPNQIRRIRVNGTVNTRVTRLVIPASVARRLGLEISGISLVRYADGRTAERAIAKNVRLAYGGRESVFNAIVEPGRESVLIGAIVLEDLDFLVDCGGLRLVPRDPKQIVSEVE
jgi:hypothetical protein